MAVEASKPLFAVVLGSGENWTVEAEWPDGTIEQAAVVDSASAAWTWIHGSAESWITGRTALTPIRPGAGGPFRH